MREANPDFLRLTHILQSIEIIEGYVVDCSFDDFVENEMMQAASIHHLEIIGEAASKISNVLRDRFSQVEWREVISLRNFVVHEYFKVDINVIWLTIIEDIPGLKRIVIKMIEEIDDEQV